MRRVAVIAVHGVADQKPGETARAISNLLANLNADDGKPAYEGFTVATVRVPVRKVLVPNDAGLGATAFAQRAASLRTMERSTAEVVDVNIEFMSTLLGGYEPSGPDETYDTTRHRAIRRERPASAVAPAAAAIQVDVYELYWADLSRLTESFVRILAEIYQLLFHLASLGVHAIRSAQVKETDGASSATWDRWGRAQHQAGDALAFGLMLPNLFMAGLLGVLAISALPLLSTVNPRITGVATLLVVALLIAWIVQKYERYRPGARLWAVVISSPVVVVFLASLLWPGQSATEPPLQRAVLRAGEVTYLILSGAWMWLLINGWLAFWCARRIMATSGATRELLMRVRWTARLTLAVPAALFSTMTTLLWAVGWPIVSSAFKFHLEAMHPQFVLGRLLAFGSVSVNSFVTQLIDHASGAGFGLMMLLTLIAVLIALVAILPAAWLEVRPPLDGADGTWVGRWLTRGFEQMRWAGRFLFLGIMVVLPIGVLVPVLGQFGLLSTTWLTWFWHITRLAFSASALLLVPSAVGVFAFRDRLRALMLHLRTVVDVLLDVDNYFREHPCQRTPRARICARYISLLRHVTAGGYGSLTVVAHSQGSVIAADLLRFITTQQARTGAYYASADLSGLAKTEMRLFTMGCPLRQLYGLRFPHLYEWARHTVSGPWHDPTALIERTTGPNPEELGVALWVNAYRSGDYVGRHLWRPDDCDFLYASAPARRAQPWTVGTFAGTFTVAVSPPSNNRREFCIGGGAHTHYWDATAPQIALELDALLNL